MFAHAQKAFDETSTAIANQHEKYQRAKKEVQVAIANTEEQLRAMNHNPTPLPAPALSPRTTPSNGNGHRPALSKRRRKQLRSNSGGWPAKTQTESDDQWQLIFTTSEHEYGTPLPPTRHPFASTLRQILEERESILDTALVYDKLQSITNMTLQQRQAIRKQHNKDWNGWKIARAGKRYRLFLDIDEAKHAIRFAIVHRRYAYGYH